MSQGLQDRCRELLLDLGLIQPNKSILAQALTGGVASDIARVVVDDRVFCVKFALAKLKVAADWFAPVHRNAAEYAWLEVAAKVAPQSAVQLFGRSESQHGFAMEYLEGEDVSLWKTQLLAEAPDQGEAAKVGALIGQVHAASCRLGFDQSSFDNRDDFHALRIEPYLTYTASVRSEVSDQLNALADTLYQSNQVLVHGDVSPKNILFRTSGPVVLDAECATMGDASFDPSFCLNHLVLKAVHLPASRRRYLRNAHEFWNAYETYISWDVAAELEARVCRLLPALMLARVDGKSPVEYLAQSECETVRGLAIQLIQSPIDRLADLLRAIEDHLKEVAQ